MLLDAVLADRRYQWLGTERDKRAYFKATLEYPIHDDSYPHLTFGSGGAQTTRFFPDKLPIGVPRDGRRHLFLYLATREVPMDFRVFLLHHAELLTWTGEWTVRVLLPRRLRRAAALYRYAVRDTFLMPLDPRQVHELDWYFRVRNGEALCPTRDAELDVLSAARTYSAARFEALRRAWLRRGVYALRAMQTHTLREQMQRGEGRVEFVQLTHQYLQLTPLVGRVGAREDHDSPPDNLATA